MLVLVDLGLSYSYLNYLSENFFVEFCGCILLASKDMTVLLQAYIALLSLDLCSGKEAPGLKNDSLAKGLKNDSLTQGLKNDSAIPFWSCCPPGSALTILETSGYRDDPLGYYTAARSGPCR